MFTWETPGRMLTRCATSVVPYRYSSPSVRVSLDRGLHVARCRIDAFAEIKLDGYAGVALRTCACNQTDPRNLRELFLKRRRDRVRHCHRISARIRCGHGNDRVIDRGQVIHCELIVTEDAEDEH